MPRSARLLVLPAVLLLAACIPGTHPPDTYTDQNGKTTTIETDKESCTRSCNDDYSRCMETGPAETRSVNAPSGMFGASADCRNALKSCLPSCKSQ